jgi:hypothetical protein
MNFSGLGATCTFAARFAKVSFAGQNGLSLR